MAVEAVKEYVNVDPARNDMVVYVGEGRGGANANDAFFEFLEGSGDWVLVHMSELEEKLGDKG
eukprot:CAMPEP_0172513856 /NCGR_PEP_ID=MMETSP1066-20121228/256026_1 /TAXON_ID=671091 /ORGANISM="Coscinodiscus wailesii, Strain CCMP2513" /LENGTH=62 /DNA_ID=CAMNT_0013294299 /DNA_START=188 /DNA_END=372 /DNA_ORIENTATION=-